METVAHPLVALDAQRVISQERELYHLERIENNDEVTSKAFSSALTYIITDAFDLSGDEIIRVAYHVNDMISPLSKVKASAIPPVVLEEIKYSRYSERLFDKTESNDSVTENLRAAPGVKIATLKTWVEGFSDFIFNSYRNIDPMYKARIVGSLQGLFSELGLNNDLSRTRPSLYLPNAIRTLIA